MEAGTALLKAEARPDAVFAANDVMALGCLFAFNEAGLQVPRDIALAGFDDVPLARFVHPTLTTMRISIAELGANAMQRLLHDIQAGGQPWPEPDPLTPELVVRNSAPTREGAVRA